jgi:ACS family hexuronate transporter-like MFS transporter
MTAFLRKWGVCLLLFLATTLNYLDRQTLAILAPTVQKEIHIDNEGLGWLFSVFYYAYTFSQFGVGVLLDRYHLRWAYGLGVLAWSATCALTGLASGFYAFIAFRLLLGVTESLNWPAALRVVSRALPPEDRQLGNGIFTSGTSIGALIAPVMILGIAGAFGWRWAFVGVGALGAVWFAGWTSFTGSPRLARVWTAGPAERAASPPLAAYGAVVRTGQFWKVFAVTILVNPILYFFVNWLPTYFVQQRGLAPGRSLGWILTAVYVGLDLGYLASGGTALWLARRGLAVPAARRIVFLAASALLLLSAVVPRVADLQAAIALLIVANFAIGVWIPVYLTMAQEVSAEHVSTAAGLLGGSGSLAGALAMWAVGRVTQQTGSFSVPLAAVSVAGILAALAGWAVTRELRN